MDDRYLLDRERRILESNDDPTRSDVVRAILRSARDQFVAPHFRTTLFDERRFPEVDGDDFRVEVRRRDHENVPKILEDVFEARFDLDVDRDGDVLLLDPDDLHPYEVV